MLNELTAFLFTALLLTLCSATAAPTLNLTGTWEGTQICTEFVGGNPNTLIIGPGDVLNISQQGMLMRMSSFGVLYKGETQTRQGAPNTGEAIAVACDAQGFDINEVVRIQEIRVGTGQSVFGEFDATSNAFVRPGTDRIFSSCTWAYTRVSIDDPNVSSCPGDDD